MVDEVNGATASQRGANIVNGNVHGPHGVGMFVAGNVEARDYDDTTPSS